MPLIGGVIAAVILANAAPHLLHGFIDFGPLDGLCEGKPVGGFCVPLHEGPPAAHDAEAGEAAEAAAEHGDDAAAQAGAPGHDGADIAGADHADPAEDHGEVETGFGLFGHHLNLHFLINDIFMLFFFGVAAKEITESVLPGGALNPPSKAVNPLMATLGGVVGPVLVYFALSTLLFHDPVARAGVYKGWGIPTATDIALAWLVARVVFGGTHPAVNFLLLLAIADDAIGLVIIAVFYPNPYHPPAPIFLLLVLAGMAVAYGLRRAGVRNWVPYIAIGGLLSWLGLLNASLHPALALVPIVPFLPGPKRDAGLFVEQSDEDGDSLPDPAENHSALQEFEHALKIWVDFGLFFFGLANAGVELAGVGMVTWIVLASLIVGKMAGVTTMAAIANVVGFKYPTGMTIRHIVVAGMVAGLGLTVALFVAGEAFPGHSPYQAPAKMGALLSIVGGLIAFVAGRALNVKKLST
ncbi:MAG: Na+/H+ antiporter NhaA [Myxococcales bacterium]|nr:Na+/H+ antiporter NhaA [Myxococcales bacterium]